MSARQKKYWESLSDEELLAAEMTTDDPEGLDDLVTEVPAGAEDPYVEFKYDLTKSGREEFSCVHGHHRHLKGFVMRKGKWRFLVGWMCGKTVYGADFDEFTTDFDTAVIRRDTLRRALEIKKATEPFCAWLTQISESDVFERFDSVREQMHQHMQWVHDNLYYISTVDVRARQINVPGGLFEEGNDPELEWLKAVGEFNTLAMQAMTQEDWAEKNLAFMKRSMENLLKRFERIILRLKELETFFQPQVLGLICDYANNHDNPKKRTYTVGMLSLSCKRDKGTTMICLPRNYKVPNIKMIESFRAILAGLQLSKATAA